MITKFYPSKKPVPVHSPARVYQQAGHYLSNTTEAQRAAKRGLSVEVYRERVLAVAKAQASIGMFVTDRGFPVKAEDLEAHGECIVVSICRHYDNYGTVQWHEPPFILSVSPMKDRSKVIHCTPNWLTKTSNFYSKSEVC
jgi:hypothetical protein